MAVPKGSKGFLLVCPAVVAELGVASEFSQGSFQEAEGWSFVKKKSSRDSSFDLADASPSLDAVFLGLCFGGGDLWAGEATFSLRENPSRSSTERSACTKKETEM